MRALKKEQKKSAFCGQNSLDRRTFDRLAGQHLVRADVVNRIEAVLTDNKIKGCTSEAIDIVVATGYGIAEQALHNDELRTRNPAVNEARQMAAYFRKEYMGMTKSAIAREMGYKDHTSVFVILKSFTGRLEVEPDLQTRLERIKGKLVAACS